jgi:hypothetical protein
MNAPTGECVAATCTQLKSQSFSAANKCAVQKQTNEDVEGCEYTDFQKLKEQNSNELKGLTSLPGMT